MNKSVPSSQSDSFCPIISATACAICLGFFLVPFSVFAADRGRSPEEFIHAYLASLYDITFRASAEFLHPEYLFEYKEQFIRTVEVMGPKGQKVILSDFGVEAIGDLEDIEDKEFYIISASNRWKLFNNPARIRLYENYIEQAAYTVHETRKITDTRYLLLINSEAAGSRNGDGKQMSITIVQTDDGWKIIDIQSPPGSE